MLLYGAKHNACETSPEMIRPIPTTDSGVTPTPENPIEQKTDIFTNVPPVVVPPIATPPADEVEVSPKPEKPEDAEEQIQPEEQPKQPEDIVVEPKKEYDAPKLEEKPKKKERKSGWVDRFRNWVDDMFTDEYI